MEVKNIHWCLRLLYLWLWGPGYWDGNTENILTWVWNSDPDGDAKVLIAVMSPTGHNGDQVLRDRAAGMGYYPHPYAAVAPRDLLAVLKDAGVKAEPPEHIKALVA